MADGEATLYKLDARDGFHTDYMIINRYDADSGVVMLGVTSPDGFKGQNNAFVQLSSDSLVLMSDWTASRIGERPTIPDPALLNPDWVLLRKLPEIAMVTVGVDGTTPLYRVSGTYVYGKKRVSPDTYSHVEFPKPAWLENGPERLLPAEFLEKGLIDTGSAGSGKSKNGRSAQALTGYITGG